jgi:hypothetical protein
MSDFNEKATPNAEPRSSESTTDAPLLGKKSPGVERMEAIAAHITIYDKVGIFIGVFLIAYAYGLDGTLRYAYQVPMSSSTRCLHDANNKAYCHVELQNAFHLGYSEHNSCCCCCRCSGMSEACLLPLST